MEDAITRAEFERLRDVAEAALLLAGKLIDEKGLSDVPIPANDPIHDRLRRIARSPETVDSLDLQHAVQNLREAVPPHRSHDRDSAH